MNKKQLDWTATERIAMKMNDAELRFAMNDCIEAGEAAWAIEQAGNHVEKDQGYYHDEASVYRHELMERAEAQV